MAQKNKAQLQAAIDALYLDCGTECITPEAVNSFEKDKTDSYAILNEDNDFSGVGAWTKQIREHKGANITVGSTLDLTNDGNYFHVTGASTVITSIETRQHGTRVSFYFVNSQTLQHSSNLLLPNATDYVTQAGEIVQFVSEGSGNWKFVSGSFQGLVFNSGQYNPTITTDFESVTNVASSYSIQGNILTSVHELLMEAPLVPISAGDISIEAPAAFTIDSSSANNCKGTWSFAEPQLYATIGRVEIIQASGQIKITFNFDTAPSGFTLYLVVQSLLA